MYFSQDSFDIRCEWGPEGLSALAPGSDVLIIVDVFSFTTCVDVAVSCGAKVYPFQWQDTRAREYAQSLGAILAIASRSDPDGFSLAPSSLFKVPAGASLVLPSLNGARLSLAVEGIPAFAGCLRNASAVAQAAQSMGRRISVIPSGERWKDGSLRPGLEDMLGAGAILSYLPGDKSVEAEAMTAVFRHFEDDLVGALAACSSGKEAAARGSPRDVDIAAELNASAYAPRLVNGAYSL